MIKKILACVLAVTFMGSMVAFAAGDFPDLPKSHWAYDDVSKMVQDGRVNGFPDGEFKPNELVTRWQFVKMMGGSDPDATSEPHRAATRGEAAEFLWIKAGKPQAFAPSAVTQNTVNVPAAAWAYTSGIMEGDDGLNLRLDGNLSRAEAAALIIRSESGALAQNDFINTVDSEILEKAWNAFGTGAAYNPDTKITNGELARLAIRIGYERRTPLYKNLLKDPNFSGDYAKDIALVCQECLGEKYATEAYSNQNATMQDMMTVLPFYTMKQAANNVLYSPEKTYSDVTGDLMPTADMGLRFARHNGILLYANDKIDAKREATQKDIACVLLQLDEIVGLNKSSDGKATKILKTLYGYPQNADDYAYILKDVPSASYETELISGVKPKDSYDFVHDYSNIFEDFLSAMKYKLPQNVKAEFVYYPSLVCESKDDLVIRAEVKITENPQGLSLNQIFANNELPKVYTGNSFFVDISVGEPISDLTLPTENAKIIRAFAK